MAMQFYASPEQIMRDRSEYARKGIARGRSAIVLTYEHGVLFVAENMTALRKVSEIYDRIGFAAVGRYNEFENLRGLGIRLADLRGYSYDRRDVTGRALANAYAQTLGSIFTQEQKPFEVEICVAQVGFTADQDELYRITYDGSVQDEPGVVVMGGQAEAMSGGLRTGQRRRRGRPAAHAGRQPAGGRGTGPAAHRAYVPAHRRGGVDRAAGDAADGDRRATGRHRRGGHRAGRGRGAGRRARPGRGGRHAGCRAPGCRAGELSRRHPG